MKHKKLSRYTQRLAVLSFAILGFLFVIRLEPALAQPAPDWKQRWEKVLSEARKEGKAVVFGPPGELIREAMTRGFSKAFPDITIEYSGSRSAEQATKLKAERDGGIYSADVFLAGTTTVLTQLKPMKAVDPIRPALILPEVTDLKYWKSNSMEFADVDGLYDLVFVNKVLALLMYNSNVVKADELSDLYQLLDPKWKGKIVLNDPLPSGAGNVAFRWIWQVLGQEKATDYYKRIRAQAGVVDRDQRRQIEWVARGKYAILLGVSDGVLEQLAQRGLKDFGLNPEFKDYGGAVTASFGSVGLINRAPHPNAAIVFLNWVLTRDGQTAWSRAMGHPSRRLDVPTDHLPPHSIPKPGGRYWLSHHEKEVTRSAEEVKILKELFGR